MKKLLLIPLCLGLLLSCQESKKDFKEPISETVNEPNDSLKLESIFNEFKVLHSELLTFKNEPDFIKYGFGSGGPYNTWLKSVQALKKNPDSKLLVKKGVLVGELEQLGYAYMTSKGKETDATQSLNKFFEDANSFKPITQIETASGIDNYNHLKSDYKLYGKWLISNSIAESSYNYEIYFKESNYIGVIPKDDFKTEILTKSQNKYSVKGSKYGEYYLINSKGEMTLFDKDGELASVGYKAVKSK